MSIILILFLVFELVCVLYISKMFISLNTTYRSKSYSNSYIAKILVVIPAHNECIQIRDTIRALKMADYPKELINIILLNDKCTDNTVNIAYEENIKIYNFNNCENTKGSVLNSFCSQYKKLINNYDYLCIIDADTLIDKDFFKLANNEFKKGHLIVQGEINSIRFNKSFVSYFMELIQIIINYFTDYQNKLKKSVMIAGKGLLISPKVLNEIEWDSNALLDDVDFSFNALLHGYSIHYCPQMKVRTKQVYTFHDMWIQQRRYASGQKQIVKKYQHLFSNKNLIGSARIYMIEGCLNLIFFFLMCVSVLNIKIYLNVLISVYISIIIIVILVAIKMSMKFHILKGILAFPFMLFYWHSIYIYSFFVPEKSWKQINNKF